MDFCFWQFKAYADISGDFLEKESNDIWVVENGDFSAFGRNKKNLRNCDLTNTERPLLYIGLYF